MSLINDHDLPQLIMEVPIIDISLLGQDFHRKSLVIKELHEACQKTGIFHVINHGISDIVLEEALRMNQNFFGMPLIMKKEIMKLNSSDPLDTPVKLMTYQNQAQGSGQLQREVLRLFAHPLEDFINLWPQNPSDYREIMGRYTIETRKLSIQLFGAIMECLNLGTATNLKENFEQGWHVVTVNNYSPYHKSSSIKIGAPPHSDHSIITILLQSSPGLQVMDNIDGTWKAVPELKGSLQVFVGDHLEVLSNGSYKSTLHRVKPITTKSRLSIASFHNFGVDEIVEPAELLVDQEHVKRYKGCSLRDLRKHIASEDPKRLIEILRI